MVMSGSSSTWSQARFNSRAPEELRGPLSVFPVGDVILRPFDMLRMNSAEESRLRNNPKKRDASLGSA